MQFSILITKFLLLEDCALGCVYAQFWNFLMNFLHFLRFSVINPFATCDKTCEVQVASIYTDNSSWNVQLLLIIIYFWFACGETKLCEKVKEFQNIFWLIVAFTMKNWVRPSLKKWAIAHTYTHICLKFPKETWNCPCKLRLNIVLDFSSSKLRSQGVLHYLCPTDLSKSFSQFIASIFIFSQYFYR